MYIEMAVYLLHFALIIHKPICINKPSYDGCNTITSCAVYDDTAKGWINSGTYTTSMSCLPQGQTLDKALKIKPN